MFDPFTPLVQQGALGIFLACTLVAIIALWRRDAKTLDLERRENAELREEIKQLNLELRNYLLERPRAQRILEKAADIVGSDNK